MKLKVTEQGVLIPKEFLEGVEEVEIQKENNVLLVISTYKDKPTKTIQEILTEIRSRRRVNPCDFGLPDSTELIREDRLEESLY